jgi:hypothetical protein
MFLGLDSWLKVGSLENPEIRANGTRPIPSIGGHYERQRGMGDYMFHQPTYRDIPALLVGRCRELSFDVDEVWGDAICSASREASPAKSPVALVLNRFQFQPPSFLQRHPNGWQSLTRDDRHMLAD